MPPGVTLAGHHVRLEPLKVEHAAELWPAAAEHDLWRYMIFDVRSVGDLEAWIARRLDAMEAGTALAFLQRDARTGEAFGSTSIFDISAHRTMEVGHTWVGASHRRTLANTEAKLLLLSHCFGVRKAIRVQLKCDERNQRSRAAILRLGATFEGVIRNQMVLPDGHKRNACVFSILDTEWPAIETRLRALLQRPVAVT